MRNTQKLPALILCLMLAPRLFAAGPAPLDACKLLPESVIAEVQGSKPTATQPTSHDDGNLSSSQCFFTLSPFSKSVSLQVISRSAGDRLEVRQFWNQRFHKPAGEASEKESEESEKGESAPPQPVRGLGEEAYWVNAGRGGALYVLQDGYLVRVSIGENAGAAPQIESTSKLARAVVEGLKKR